MSKMHTDQSRRDPERTANRDNHDGRIARSIVAGPRFRPGLRGGVAPRFEQRRISRDEPVVLTETNRFGVVVWHAPAPERTDRDQVGDVQFIGQWIAEPRPTAFGRHLQKLQLTALFAPDRSFGACGQHPTGQILSVVTGTIAGPAVGAYGLGGQIALAGGLVLGAMFGFLAYLAIAVSGRRRLHGPVTTDDADQLETVIELAAVGTADLRTDLKPADVAHRLAWQLTSPMLADAEYRRLRYQSRMLAHACAEVRQAQDTLDIANSTGPERTGNAAGSVDQTLDQAADLIERLRFRSQGLQQVATAIRAIRIASPSSRTPESRRG